MGHDLYEAGGENWVLSAVLHRVPGLTSAFRTAV